MVRFIDIGKQYWGGLEYSDNDDDYREEFAFIDTAVDRFIDVNGRQYWDCWDDFAEDYNVNGGWDNKVSGGKIQKLDRFKSLMDDKFFRDSS